MYELREDAVTATAQHIHNLCTQNVRKQKELTENDAWGQGIRNVRHLPCHLDGLNTTHILTFTKNSIQRYFGTSFHRRCLLI